MRRKPNHHNLQQERSQLKDTIDTAIRRVSNYLNEKSSRLSQKKLRRLLIILVACWGTACIVIIVDSLLSQKMAYEPQKLAYPEVVQPGSARDSGLSRTQAHIAKFQWYLDSIRIHDPDRYLRMLNTRPGLLDSLHQAEHNLSRLNY